MYKRQEEFVARTKYRCGSCNVLHKSGEDLVFCSLCQTNGCGNCLPIVLDTLPAVCYTCFHKDIDKAIQDQVASAGSASGSSSDDDDSSDSGEGEAEVSAETLAVALDPGNDGKFVLGRRAAGSVEDEIVQHTKLKTLHLSHDVHTFVLSCGRRFSLETHTHLFGFPVFDYPRCRDCFGNLQEEG